MPFGNSQDSFNFREYVVLSTVSLACPRSLSFVVDQTSGTFLYRVLEAHSPSKQLRTHCCCCLQHCFVDRRASSSDVRPQRRKPTFHLRCFVVHNYVTLLAMSLAFARHSMFAKEVDLPSALAPDVSAAGNGTASMTATCRSPCPYSPNVQGVFRCSLSSSVRHLVSSRL